MDAPMPSEWALTQKHQHALIILNINQGNAMVAGRPTEYREEYCDKLIEFFERPLTEMIDGKRVSCELPQFIQFAQSIGVHYATITRWCHQYPEFRNAYNQAKQIQESILVGNSIQNRYNPYFAQFMLKNCHGWRDKSADEADEPLKVELSDYRENKS